MFSNEINQETYIIQTFCNEDLGDVRGLIYNGTSYVSGSDVAKCLGYSNVWDALAKHVSVSNKIKLPIRTVGSNGTIRVKNMVFINEAGLNELIVKSRMPKALELREWIFYVIKSLP